MSIFGSFSAKSTKDAAATAAKAIETGRLQGTADLDAGYPTQEATDTRPRGLIPSPADLPKPGESAIRALESATEPLYEPRTKAGEFGTHGSRVRTPGPARRLERCSPSA